MHVKAGDILVMPANYLHFVLTKGDAMSMGTNFLSFGHLPMIRQAIINEYPKPSDVKFPSLPEMLVLMIYQIVEKLNPRLYHRLVSIYSTVRSIYDEDDARQVKFFI